MDTQVQIYEACIFFYRNNLSFLFQKYKKKCRHYISLNKIKCVTKQPVDHHLHLEETK